MEDDTRIRFALAVDSPNPVSALIEIAKAMKSAGKSQREIYAVFHAFLNTIAQNEKQADSVRDVMDYIAGWCNPDQAIFNTRLNP